MFKVKSSRDRFEDILDEEEQARAASCLQHALKHPIGGVLPQSPMTVVNADVYGEFTIQEDRGERSPIEHGWCELVARIGELSVPELRALRKKAAYRLHPDRAHACQTRAMEDALADINARIDAALRKSQMLPD